MHKLIAFPVCLALLGATCLPAAAEQTSAAALLEKFQSYEQGAPVEWVATTRQAVFQGTADPQTRAARERELVAFLSSGAHVQAKAIAIEWLGCLGSPASVPALVAARTKHPELAGPVAAALARIPGTEAAAALAAKPQTPAKLSPSSSSAAALAAAVDQGPASAAADDALLTALRSNDDLLAGAALRKIRAGAGSPGVTAKILAALASLPATRQAAACQALATRLDAAPALRPALLARAKTGEPADRAAAITTLGRVMNGEDVPFLLECLAATDSAITAAARAAFARGTDSGIDGALLAVAQGSDQAKVLPALDTLAERNATAAIPALWEMTTQPASPLATAAVKTLGALLPTDELPKLLAKTCAAAASPLADPYAKAVWELVRRHPEPAAAAAQLEKAAAPAPLQETLNRYAARIRPKPASAAAGPALELPAQDDRGVLAPDGFEKIIDLNCGSFAEATGGQATIRRTTGDTWQFGSVAHPLATVDYGKRVAYQIDGLTPGTEYVLGLSAWDADQGGRRQTVAIDDTPVLTNFAPLAWHADKPTFTRVHLPLAPEAVADGKVTVTVTCEAGPNAVVSQLWLLRKTPVAGAAPAKRVLLVTGDDFPGHRWRETGPAFAAVLRAGQGLEVTVAESPALLGSPLLARYHAVFLHFKNYANRLPTAEPLWKNLESFIHNGGGLVVAHFGCGAFQEWNGYAKLAGRVWDPKKRGHDPYGEFLVRILATGHPATTGLKDFTTTDELYTCLVGDTPVTPLAEATSKVDQTVHPMAFVLTPGKGRVFHCPLGHDLGALKADGARALYLQGTRWAAGL